MTKRIFDVSLSLFILMITLPLICIVILLIILTEGRPLLFKQERIGRHGIPFRILKFRTMRPTPSGNSSDITVGADPRITRIGHILRQTKIDELPQLLNVVAGEMSLVGPRPETAAYVSSYPENLRLEIQRVRPGITDRGSIKYRNEAELLTTAPDPELFYRTVILPDKVALGVEYARNHSVLGDTRILLDTVFAILKPQKHVSELNNSG